MADENYTAIGIVVDKSSSMSSHVEHTIDGFNELLDDQRQIQKNEGTEVTVTTTFFNHEFPPTIKKGMKLGEIQELDEDTYVPNGRTALFDAVGYTIDEMGKRFDEMDESEKPENVVLAIITDGKENSSKEYHGQQVKDMIEKQEEEWGWEIIFIGAGIDAFEEAGNIGIDHAKTMSSRRTKQGMNRTYKAASKAIGQTQITGGVDSSWKDVSEDEDVTESVYEPSNTDDS